MRTEPHLFSREWREQSFSLAKNSILGVSTDLQHLVLSTDLKMVSLSFITRAELFILLLKNLS